MQQQSARNARAGAHDFQGPADIATAPASSEKQAEPLARGVQVYSPQSRLGVLIFSCDESGAAINPPGTHAPAPRLVTTLHRSTSHPTAKGEHPCSGYRLLNSQTAFKMNLTVWTQPTTLKAGWNAIFTSDYAANIQERKKLSETSRSPEQSVSLNFISLGFFQGEEGPSKVFKCHLKV